MNNDNQFYMFINLRGPAEKIIGLLEHVRISLMMFFFYKSDPSTVTAIQEACKP